MGQHARLSPSSAKRWMICAAAPDREAMLPDSSGPAAAWGNAAHAILESSILKNTNPMDLGITGLTAEDEEGNPCIIEERYGLHDLIEQRECARIAYEYTLFKGKALAESKVNPGELMGRNDCSGTADIQIISPGNLEVIDLKSGFIQIEPSDPQLWLYGAGGYAKCEELSSPETDTITLTIVQPRSKTPHPQGVIRSITLPVSHVLNWCQTEAKTAAERTDDPNAPVTPDKEACRFCRAKDGGRHVATGELILPCKELAEQGLSAAQAVFKPVAVGGDRQQLAQALTRNPDQLTMEDIRFILDNESLISGWLSSVRKFASETIKGGGVVPGRKMVRGNRSRSWDQEEKNLVKTFRALDRQDKNKIALNQLYNKTLLTPAGAEKNLKPLVSKDVWETITGHIITSPGKPTLAPETDSREAVKTNVNDIFQPVPTPEEIPDFLR